MFTINLQLNPQDHPNEIGEILRKKFFTDEGYGCYENFNVNPEVAGIHADFKPNEYEVWTVYRHYDLNVEMRYHWDGDGTLMFIFEDNSAIVNTDCKKDYCWRYYENVDQFFAYDF